MLSHGNTRAFREALKALNKEQREAVEAIDGPVMVVAGPGTGKTQVLTLRIANILARTDTAPENILALTFTEAASTNMRKRLLALIGATAYRVRIQTFHSFCNDILHSYPEYFPHVVGGQSITEVEASLIIEKIVRESKLEILRPWGAPLLYVGEILKKIEELKREGIDPFEFKKIVAGSKEADKRKIQKNKELALIYEKYQKKLFESKFYDYSDMILQVLKKLEIRSSKSETKNDLKTILQENHQYVLVDEHQDTNNAQNKILELLLDFHRNPNIFVVGDHKQAIFRFQGASVENFVYFKNLYPEAKLIELFRNYRSTQSILDAAENVIKSIKSLMSVKQKAGEKIKIVEFRDSNQENYWVAVEISNLKYKISNLDVAIIYRSNKEAFAIADNLRKKGIEFAIESDEDIFDDKFVRKFISLIYAVHHYGDDEHLAKALHLSELGVPLIDLYNLTIEAQKNSKSLYKILPKELAHKIERWAVAAKEEDAHTFLANLLRESELLASMLKSRDASAFLGIEGFLEEARRHKTLTDFIRYLDTLKTHELYIKRPKLEAKDGVVRLMTAHKAKGLEFDTVFIVNCSEKSFGVKAHRELLPLVSLDGAHQGENSEIENDTRRLFYVALTRAKKNIYITYHTHDLEGKELLPCAFIDEIKKELKEKIEVKIDTKDILLSEDKALPKEIDREFVEKLFYSRGFSVTALNNYLDCPWKYFYRNLIRIPEAREKYLLYGTAMHETIEAFFKERLKKGKIELKFLLDSFKKNISGSGLRGNELEEASEKGIKSLTIWYKERKNSWKLPCIIEKNITGVYLDKVMLSGKLDKMEILPTGEVTVTDYKTGKSKSRNEIEKGDMKRQLVFYKLLLDLDAKYKMESSRIEFLEPTEAGHIKFEDFEISDSEAEDLKKIIKKTAAEITSLSFWNSFCDDKLCKYCGYRKLLL